MRVVIAHFKTIVAAVGLICVITVSLFVPPAAGTGGQRTASAFVDRTNKGDRLPDASRLRTHVNKLFPTTTPRVAPRRPPLGCDAAFSSAAEPTQSHIYKRCVA